MIGTNKADAPIVVEEKRSRRRGAAIYSSAALGVALLAGLTLAAFTDGEFVGLNHNTDGSGSGFGIAQYNLQVREYADPTNTDNWTETTNQRDPSGNLISDNLPGAVVPINLTDSSWGNIMPGDESTYPTVKFQVRNDETSTLASTMALTLIDDVNNIYKIDGRGGSDAGLLAALTFKVTVTTEAFGGSGATATPSETYDFTALSETGIVVSGAAKPGAVFTIEIQIGLPDQGSAVLNSAFQGQHVFLIAAVNGEAVNAA
ncbi:MAG: hypothetical protein LBJ44_05235 [Propionibacteriaceae bacterium]|jgi:hypothetical protein|nr:hypothetical protein [Propionibacteriaceae bacterium]